ncbi:hypothetical protein [Nonomuraea sp. NPDC003709]|uniref:hypothetical protein n=1 Tax=Nonomuraea sp. NPDC003709 TaxID=3154450 RepID=UPI0033AFD42D
MAWRLGLRIEHPGTCAERMRAVVVPREFTVGVSLVLWAFGSWLIPLLVALGVWRHVRCRVPLRWE